MPFTAMSLLALTPLFMALSKNALLEGWAENVTGGLTAKLLEGTLAGLARDRRNRLNDKTIRIHLAKALELAISCTLAQLGPTLPAERRLPFAEALQTWVKNEKVQDCFGCLLDPRKDAALDLDALTHYFAESSPEVSTWALELDFPGFVTWLAGCFHAAVEADDVLREHFALTDLEALVLSAEKQCGLLEQLQQNTALSARIQARQLEANQLTAASTTATAENTRQIAQNTATSSINARAQLQEQKKTNRSLKKVERVLSQPEKEKEQARRGARLAWLQVVSQECSSIPLQGLDTDAADSERARTTPLSGIYIALNTTSQVDVKKGRRKAKTGSERALDMQARALQSVTVLEAAARSPRMVLLGTPGSGKSTFVRHLALSLAQGQLAENDNMRATWWWQLQPLSAGQLERLPVVVVLRELAAWLAAQEPDTTPAMLTTSRSQAIFKRYLEHWCQLNDKQLCLVEVWKALEQGTALLLLDGLDEIPGTGPRIEQVKAVLEGLAEGWPKTAMLVTCRVLSWQDPRWKLDRRWTAFELDALNDGQIADFIRRWYQQLAMGGHIKHPQEKIHRLQQAAQRPELRELAGNPLLLTVMALLHGHRGELPDSRVLLYEETVDLLLQRWERTNKPDLDRSRALQDWLSQAPCHLSDLKRALSRLAFIAHQRGGELAEQQGDVQVVTADISEDVLKLELAKLHPRQELVWVQTGLDLIKERAGLLVESQPKVYHFPHRTFQEYLAARHLGGQKDYAKQSLRLAKQGTYWWEALRLSAARLVQVEVGDKALALVAALCPIRESPVRDANGWRQVCLAGDLLRGIFGYAQNEPLGKELLERTREYLTRLVELGVLTERERCDAGRILGHLGDPRLGLEKPERWVWIAPGEFTMGSDEAEDATPLRRVSISRGFWLGKYPVTNQEYREFVEDGGYRERKWWSEEGWAWLNLDGDAFDAWFRQLREQDKNIREESKDDFRPESAPKSWGNEQFNAPNQPVVGVSWYEAEAFCRWSSSRLQGKRLIWWREELVARPPTEAEWEYAARGTGNRRYPWGSEEPDVERTNYAQRVGATSPVGIYPLGRTPEGALDMAGNVFEYCCGTYHPISLRERGNITLNHDVIIEDSRRGVRGGAWLLDRNFLSPVQHFSTKVGNRNNFVGFRMVLTSVFPEARLDVTP